MARKPKSLPHFTPVGYKRSEAALARLEARHGQGRDLDREFALLEHSVNARKLGLKTRRSKCPEECTPSKAGRMLGKLSGKARRAKSTRHTKKETKQEPKVNILIPRRKPKA